jgi:hypothetical protein
MGFFIRHVRDLQMDNIQVQTKQADGRPAFVLDDVSDVRLSNIRSGASDKGQALVLRDVREALLLDFDDWKRRAFKEVKSQGF